MAQAGISTLGVKLSYGIETVAGQKPTKFDVVHRINSIGGITIEPETIDASALEDSVTRSVAGRGTSAGNFTVGVNVTNDTIAEWQKVIADYKDIMDDGLRVWWQVSSPSLAEAYYVVAQPPLEIPMPDFGQNELLVVEIPLTIDEFLGMSAKVEPNDSDPEIEEG
jgi:hypothetical protein